MRSDLTPWTVRGMGLAVGVLIVYGLVQLGTAAASVLLRLQARERPVDELGRSLPDGANAGLD